MISLSPKSVQNEPPWGIYAPKPVQALLISWARAMPRHGLGRTVAGLLRRMVMGFLKTPLDVQTFGAPIRFHPHDNLTEKRVAFMPQFFDREERAALASIIHPEFVFIDIGANAGFYALIIAGLAGKTAKIIAVEPQPEMARRLKFNCAAGGFSQIIHEGVALAAKDGKADMHIVHENRGASGFSPRGHNAGNETIMVRTMALLALMDRHNIERADAIKIDIEGAEDEVLPVFFETCAAERLPKMIILERNEDWRVDCVKLALEAGYVEAQKARKNIILTRPAKP